MTAQELYIAMQRSWLKETGVTEGSTVKVIRQAVSKEMGWAFPWISPDMDNAIGKTFQVTGIGPDAGGLLLGGVSAFFPYFCLEVVEAKPKPAKIVKTIINESEKSYQHQEKPVTITNGSITIGCQTLKVEAVKAILEAVDALYRSALKGGLGSRPMIGISDILFSYADYHRLKEAIKEYESQ